MINACMQIWVASEPIRSSLVHHHSAQRPANPVDEVGDKASKPYWQRADCFQKQEIVR